MLPISISYQGAQKGAPGGSLLFFFFFLSLNITLKLVQTILQQTLQKTEKRIKTEFYVRKELWNRGVRHIIRTGNPNTLYESCFAEGSLQTFPT